MSGMHDTGWDRPADSRHGPFPLNPMAVSATGLVAEVARGGLSLALSKRGLVGVWGKVVAQSGGLYSWYEVQDDGTGANWVKNYNGFDYTGTYNAKDSGGSSSVSPGTVAWFRRHEGLGGQGFAFTAPASGSLAVHYDDGTGGASGCTELDFTKANFTLATAGSKVTAAPRYANSSSQSVIAGSVVFSPTTLAGSGTSTTLYLTGTSLSDFALTDGAGGDQMFKLGTVDGNGKNRLALQNGTLFQAWGALYFTVPSTPTTVGEEFIEIGFGNATWSHNIYGQLSALFSDKPYAVPPGLVGTGDLALTVTNNSDKTVTFTKLFWTVLRLT